MDAMYTTACTGNRLCTRQLVPIRKIFPKLLAADRTLIYGRIP